MKKPVIAAVALVAAAGVSFGALFAVNNHNKIITDKQAKEMADYILTDFESADVSQFSITTKDGASFTMLKDEEGFWSGKSADGTDFPANSSAADGICQAASNLEAKNDFGEITDDKLSEYGLDDPYVLELTLPDRSVKISVGDNTPTNIYSYVMIEGKEKIYAVELPDISLILTSELGMKDAALVDFDENDISYLSAVKDGEKVYALTRKAADSNWELEGKFSSMELVQTKVSSELAVLTRVTAKEILSDDPADLSKFGLDDPLVVFTVKTFDGRTRNLTVAPCTADNSLYYIYIDDNQITGTFLRGDLTVFNYEPSEFIDKQIANPQQTIVSEMSFTCPDGSDTFTFNEEGIPQCRGKSIDTTNAEISGYFSSFYDSMCFFAAEDCDVDITPDLKDPVLHVEYTKSADGSVTTMDIVDVNGTGYAFSNGKYTGLTVDTEDYLGYIRASYDSMCEHAGLESALK